MTRHTIQIDKDGWVSHTFTDKSIVGGYIEKGLGDIGVDVEVVDLRGDTVQQERTRIIEDVEKEINRVLDIQYSGVRPNTDFEKGYTTAYQNIKHRIINIIKNK